MRTALVTASFRGDLDRARLLFDSIDRRVSGHTRHLVLVEKQDLALFRPFAGPRREIVDEREILPRWLRVVPDPVSLGRRRVWLSPKGPPLRGWHVQQLRKLAIAALVGEDAVLLCDSDTVFVRETDVADQWSGGALRFYRKPGAIGPDMAEHRRWQRRAAELLGLADAVASDTDYVAQVVGWRTDSVRAMLERIEEVAGRPWIEAVARRRAFSECLIYGRYVEEFENRPDRHLPVERSVCHSYWLGSALDMGRLRSFVAAADPSQPAIGVQSFIGTDIALIRAAAGLA